MDPPEVPRTLSPPIRGSAARLVNRRTELEALQGLLDTARSGSSAVLVLRGGPGIGKTTLLEHAIQSAAGMPVAQVGGVETEFGLPYAALHQFLAPFTQGMNDLPGPQRDALATTLGFVEGEHADRFLIALAVLTLLSDAANEASLLCAVDDAEWLDEASAQVLSFVARRLDNEGVALLVTVGTPGPSPLGLKEFRELHVGELKPSDSRELIGREVAGILDNEVRDVLVDEAAGNPLALIEFARGLTADQLSGLSPLPEALPLGGRLEASLMHDVRSLAPETQTMLMLVASERSGDPGLLRRAADGLGLSQAALGNAETVLRLGTQITFRHGLVRSAVYAAASEASRREAHLALAAAMDPEADEDRAAWHRAAASLQPDETVAADLEASARKARERGGHAAAAAVLELAAKLSPDPARRAARLLVAAQAELAAAALDKASRLLSQAPLQLLDEEQRADAQVLRGGLSLARGENGRTASLLLEAARAMAPFDLRKARNVYLDALVTAMFAGRLAGDAGVHQAATLAREAPSIPEADETAGDILLDGFALLFTEGSAAAAPTLRRGIDASAERGDLRAVGTAYQAAFELWDEPSIHALAQRRVDLARATGALIALPNALHQLGGYEIVVGRFDAAEALFDEAREIAAATETPGILGDSNVGGVLSAAWRGEEERARTLAAACRRDGTARGFGTFVGFAQYALSVLELGLGQYREAMLAAQDARLDTLLRTRVLPELVEAAVRCDEREIAEKAAVELAESTSASRTPWGLGTIARSRALLAARADAEQLYREAVDQLTQCRAIPQLARARLVYGEWLRRERRRRDARDELRLASELFEAVGAQAFAQRAESELAATGARIRRRKPGTVDLLTPHERRIATLVSEGASNSEVAAELFISPRTVEYHLAKVFRKLRITSRAEIARALQQPRRKERN